MNKRDTALVAMVLAVVVLGLAGVSALVKATRGDRYVPSSSVRLWLDPETGCEYFVDSYRPRLGSDGRPICNVEGVTKP